MKKIIYKKVVELGHYIPNFCIDWDEWVVDSVIDEAERVLEYVEEAKKETTSFFRGVYTSNILGNFCITYYPIGIMNYKEDE